MAPPSNFDKAIADRNTLLNTIFYLEDELVDHATTPLIQAQVDNFLTTVNQCQGDVLEIHNRIQHSVPADILDHNTIYYDTRKRISKLLAKFTTIKLSFPSTTTSSATATISSEIKLPPLQLPTFDGNLHEWISFKDIFNTIVIQNNKFGKSQKLTYLKLQLRGEAARQVQSLQITDANFDVAWSQLTNRYQSDRELFLAVYNKLFDQPQVISKSSDSIRQLIDVTQECKRSLEGLNIPTDPLDSMFVAVLIRKMDSSSRELWERTLLDNSIPKVKTLIDFLEQQARALSSSGNSAAGNKQSQPKGPSRHTRANPQPQFSYHVQSSPKCKICHDSHIQSYFKCRKFMTMPIPERIEVIKKIQSCYNCLSDGHSASQCPSSRLCRQCNRKHHTLLHRQVETSGGTKPQEALPLVHYSNTPVSPVDFDTILATAIVEVTDCHGHPHQCRAFVDSGSNTHYITEELIKKLGLPRKRYCVTSKGLGGASVGVSSFMTQFSVSSLIDKAFSFPISRCLVTKTITCQLPVNPFNHQKWSHLHNIPLADPEYHTPKNVDMLLGSEFFFAIFGCEKRSGPPNSPVAIKTGFGWLIGGGSPQPTNHPTNQSTNQLVHSTLSTSMGCDHENNLYDIDLTLRKQWEMDSEPSDRLRTHEENAAEAHFLTTYRRDPTGRFLVELPFKAVAPAIGSSLSLAVKRLQYLERRLTKLPDYRQEYEKFMQEYENLGHMKEVPPVPLDSNQVCYIPHHFVLKESSSTTKFRVVFDASAKTSTGVSLNDTMMVGPTIQDSLFEILCRFRLHKYAFTADIAKMYRQVLINPSNNPQRIVWRSNPTLPIKHF
jgi:hypothetical protein